MRLAIALVIVAIVVAVVALRAGEAPSPTSSRTVATATSTPRLAGSGRAATTGLRALPRPPTMRPMRGDDARASGAGNRVSPLRLVDGVADEASLGVVREAIVELYPHLAACHEASIDELDDPALELELEMTVEPGTDARSTLDADVLAVPGQPRPPEMIECVRAVLGSLELPAVRERLRVGYLLSFP